MIKSVYFWIFIIFSMIGITNGILTLYSFFNDYKIAGIFFLVFSMAFCFTAGQLFFHILAENRERKEREDYED